MFNYVELVDVVVKKRVLTASKLIQPNYYIFRNVWKTYMIHMKSNHASFRLEILELFSRKIRQITQQC